MDRLNQVEDRLSKATTYPWAVRRSLPGAPIQTMFVVNPAGDAEAGDWMIADGVRWAEDAELIAHAPADLRWLITEVKDLRAKLDRATDLVRFARHYLREQELLSEEEYAALVMDSENGQRVARLESYDEIRAKLAQAEAALAAEAAKVRQMRAALAAMRDNENAVTATGLMFDALALPVSAAEQRAGEEER